MDDAERIRNARLRRADWRFLLDEERVPVVLCSAAGALADAVRAVSVPARDDGAEADLAVLARPRRRTLAAARRRLRPGGEVYAEWYVPRLGGIDAARRRLERAGFTDVRCYWPWPPPARGRTNFWLPVDAPSAVDAHLRGRPSRRRARRAVEELWRFARRAGVLVPVCAVARKPGSATTGVDAWMRERWGAQTVSWLLLASGFRSVNKVVGLAFIDSERTPRAAVKFARSAAEDEQVRAEAANLRLLREHRPRLPGAPEVLDVALRCGRVALVQTPVRGRPLMETLTRATFPRHAAAVTDWLVELAGPTDPTPSETWWPRLVDEPLNEFERWFGRVIDPGSAAHARRVIAAVERAPLVYEHRDCSPWNILVDSTGEPAVVDWESSEPRGLAGLDLAYFLTNAAGLVAQREDWWAAPGFYDELFEPRTLLGGTVERCERRYCERVGLERTSLGPLRLLCWAIHARSDYRRIAAEAAGSPSEEALRRSAFLHLWREELRRQTRSRGRS
jgi:hypothetical protein